MVILFRTSRTSRSDLTHLRVNVTALRFTVETVILIKAEITVRRDLDVLSIFMLLFNLQ